MRKVTEIKQGDRAVTFIFDDGNFAIFAEFGKDIFTTVSPGILKKTLVKIKEDIKQFGFDAEIMRGLWI